uniref:TROVE domain-containing protein n=1 Tax=Aegilops tauschii subsp. strangulata TaxID=200361 RepID=A0A453T418_AEGTS
AAAACRRAVSSTLRGPPIESLAATAACAAAPTGDQFVDLLDANFNRPAPPPPPKTRTENNSPTFATSGDPCLDFFFHVVPGTPAGTVSSLLANAWAAEPTTALRLACNLRGVRGTGKADREGFYAAALWMHGSHPATLALNARPVAEFGYLKDLPEILHRIIHGGVSTRKPGKQARLAAEGGGLVARAPRPGRRIEVSGLARRNKKRTRRARIAASQRRDLEEAAQAAVARRKKRTDAAATAVQRYTRDQNYRLLHDMTAEVFADLLAEDLKKLAAGNMDLSLAGKWCPSVDSCYDRSTLICEAIARRLFPKGSARDLPEDLPDAHYAYRVRERLRKEAYVPLRHALKLPEIFISAGEWAKVVYTRVSSVAMKNYKEHFVYYDQARFARYLADVEAGKVKIAAGALLPHEILTSAYFDPEVANLQWKRTVDDLLALGKLNNCLAVCDVSGSMSGLPMDVCVSLGLLLSELCDEPWRHRVITFSMRPQLHHVVGDTLWEKAQFVQRMEWAMNTDFQAVFDQLLHVAVAGKLPPESMVKKVFVFSDMEFDQASARPWETDYEAITRKYTEAGYADAIPQIVFWNLRDSRSVPVTSEQKGVALVSGFSQNMLKLFLGKEVAMTPRSVMEKAIAGPLYEKLVVFD